MSEVTILTINTGSSSLKLGIYAVARESERMLLDGFADGIGEAEGSLALRDGEGKTLRSERIQGLTQESALLQAIAWLNETATPRPCAVGHRIVHGGPNLTQHQRITPAVLQELRRCVHFAPLHIPTALNLIEEAAQAYPDIPQFACFDTAFHRTLPEAASRFPISQTLADEGIRRYGFHGLSYESIVNQLGKSLPSRVVAAHLGGGASLVALKNGQSVDTTMGLTPTGGIVMATRSGDLDPGLLLYLMRAKGMGLEVLESMLNHDAGLKAISNGISDMRQLLAVGSSGDSAAKLAIEIFCSAVAKEIAAYAAVLDGLDLVAFAGGIGEHSSVVRENVCQRLRFLGLQLDHEANRAGDPVISTQESSALIRTVESNEDLEIARHCRRLFTNTLPATPPLLC